MNSYLTIENQSIGVYKDRKSKFIGIAEPVKNDIEIKQTLNKIKSDYYDATHHCYAYRFLNKDFQIVEHWNDDGEPANSAGIQIYYAIKKFELLNILVVVVRYYGGVKLGVSGLINAYKNSAAEAIKSATIIEKIITKSFSIKFKYEHISKVMFCLKKHKAHIKKQNLELDCFIEAEVNIQQFETLKQELKLLNIETIESL
ncbi:MAG: IMPACT family protein [Bacteroidales bacterium]